MTWSWRCATVWCLMLTATSEVYRPLLLNSSVMSLTHCLSMSQIPTWQWFVCFVPVLDITRGTCFTNLKKPTNQSSHMNVTWWMIYLSVNHSFVMFCMSVYYTILYYTILYYTILYYTILYYTILYYTILYYTILYYTILYYTMKTCEKWPSQPLRLLKASERVFKHW